MSPKEMETILKHYMSELPEDSLSKLDEKLSGKDDDDTDPTGASDAALKHKKWLDMPASTRSAIRASKVDRVAQDSTRAQGFAERFPGAQRIKNL